MSLRFVAAMESFAETTGVDILDQDFGPLFIKFCSYLAKLCPNAHEWLNGS